MSNKFRELIKCSILFLIGGCLYYCIEILWRGHSHWTMAVVGGICFLVIGGLNNYIPWEMPLWKQAGIGALFVTATELVVGVPLGLLFPAVQSVGANLSAVHSAMVLPCTALHFC